MRACSSRGTRAGRACSWRTRSRRSCSTRSAQAPPPSPRAGFSDAGSSVTSTSLSPGRPPGRRPRACSPGAVSNRGGARRDALRHAAGRGGAAAAQRAGCGAGDGGGIRGRDRRSETHRQSRPHVPLVIGHGWRARSRRANPTTATFFPRRSPIPVAHSRRSTVRGSRSLRIDTATCTSRHRTRVASANRPPPSGPGAPAAMARGRQGDQRGRNRAAG
jgi:hypothetical protein